MPREIQTHVQIANLALRILQSDEIESFAEDSSTARTVKMYYFNVFSNCLAQHPWSFATKVIPLQMLATAPLEGRYGYKLPTDLIFIVGVGGDAGNCSTGGGIGYEVLSDGVLVTPSTGPLWIRYVYDAPVAYLPAYFIDFFVHALVEELAAVFGYNLDGQRIAHDRVWGKNGKLGYAIRQDRKFSPKPALCGDGIGVSRAW
jgi:hypothetical protein